MRRGIAAATRIATVLVLITVGWVGVVIGAAPAGACSCGMASDGAAFADSVAVFTGTLTERRDQARSGGRSSANPVRLVFAVDRVYKGSAFAEQSVVNAASGSSCGLEVTGSGPFLVFTHDDPMLEGVVDGELATGLCSSTRNVTADQPVPASFGSGAPPSAGASPVGPDRGGSWMPWVAGFGGIVVLVAIAGIFAARRRRGPAGADADTV